ncbi:group II intron maturase-specific domain-containing protein [Desulfoplanes sp.]
MKSRPFVSLCIPVKTATRIPFISVEEVVKSLSPYLAGWSGYFNFGYPRKACRQANHFAQEKLVNPSV